MLHGPECWALSKADARKIDALDQWCLRRILDIRWYHRVSNCEVRCMMEQPPLTAIIQKRRLMLFGHLARMDETADARRIPTGVHQSDWSRPQTMCINIYHKISESDLLTIATTIIWVLLIFVYHLLLHTNNLFL